MRPNVSGVAEGGSDSVCTHSEVKLPTSVKNKSIGKAPLSATPCYQLLNPARLFKRLCAFFVKPFSGTKNLNVNPMPLITKGTVIGDFCDKMCRPLNMGYSLFDEPQSLRLCTVVLAIELYVFVFGLLLWLFDLILFALTM